nr:TPM domain-containing protein [Desulfobacterales bacterium]
MKSRQRLHVRLLALLMAIGLLAAATPASALEVPPLKGRVNDYGAMLSPATRQGLEGMLRDLEQTDSTQIVVLTIPSLEGDSLEAFSLRVVEQWQIGQKDVDNGALLLISRADRKLRIEVGYGLEGRLTALVSGRIIRDVIVPHFKAGQIDQGVLGGVQAMIAAVKGEFVATAAPERRGSGSRHGLFGLMMALFILNILGRLRRPLGILAGGVMVPIIGTAVLGFSLTLLLILIPAGLMAGLLAGFLGGPLSFGHAAGRSRGGGFWIG